MSKAKKANEKTGQMEALEEIEIELPNTAQSGQEVEEEPLRQRLEKEMKKLKDDEQKIKNRQKEEEERKMKLQKIQQELKQKDYTFDHNGTIIYTQKLNVDKLVPDKYQMKYVFMDGFNQESTIGTLSRLGRDFSKSKTKILPPIEQQRSQKQSSSVKPPQEKLAKKTPKQEKDFVQKMTKSQSSTFSKEDINIQIFDNIKLASGVNLKESNKSKKGVEPPKSNRITLTEYKKLVEQNLSVPENKQLISAISDTTSFEKEKGTRKFASARNL